MPVTVRCPDAPLKIIERLRAAGHSAYVVGGCVRDTLLGISPNDWDVTTSALPEETLEIFKNDHTIPTGLKHGTVTVMIEHEPYEITTFRIDGTYSDSRHPESVTFSNRIADDLARRDFTINALAWNPYDGTVDCFDGISDLEHRIIRAVGVAKDRFEEDALRILRGYRFSAQLDFCIEKETHRALISESPRLTQISRERVSVEFRKLSVSKAALRVLKMLETDGIFTYIFTAAPYRLPECVDRITELRTDFEDRLAFLLYGCPPEELSAQLRDLKLSNQQTDDIKTLADISGLIRAFASNPPTTEADAMYLARRILAKYGDLTERAAKIAELYGHNVAELFAFVSTARENGDPLYLSDLTVSGKDLIAGGIAKGKAVGTVLAYLLDLVLHDPNRNEKSHLLSLASEYVRSL